MKKQIGLQMTPYQVKESFSDNCQVFQELVKMTVLKCVEAKVGLCMWMTRIQSFYSQIWYANKRPWYNNYAIHLKEQEGPGEQINATILFANIETFDFFYLAKGKTGVGLGL